MKFSKGQASNMQPAHLMPGEILHYIERKHWFVLVIPLLLSFLFLIASTGLIFTLTLLLQVESAIPALVIILFFLITLGLTAKILIDWMFNFYIITSHKISETKINPLFGDSISEVLLKQVRCTEIDIVNFGIVNQLLNKGDVHITFDRPTHRDEFILSDISNPREIGAYLSDILIEPAPFTNNVWFRNKFADGGYRYAEEIGSPFLAKGGEVL